MSLPPGPPGPADKPARVQIRVRGQHGPWLAAAFEDAQLFVEPVTTVLEVAVDDDEALFDVLHRVQSLALHIREIHVRPRGPDITTAGTKYPPG